LLPYYSSSNVIPVYNEENIMCRFVYTPLY
jgi:hypothetical protein